ncbi:MAG: Holliday junction resolvase RuvX, partial [Candidatus Margulisiibacteriota bacterium]
MRILSIDYGEKRTGIAISDPLGFTGQPLKTIPSTELIKSLKELCDEYEVDKIILGFPIKMDGTEGPAAQKMRVLHEQLKKAIPLEIELVDERLTTACVQ